MAEAKTREQLERDWWDGWWAQDYSWKGLADTRVGAEFGVALGGLHGEKTLQDYWRRDPETGVVRDDAALKTAGEMIECDGVDFHIAHLPRTTKAGLATWKDNLRNPAWDRLEALLARRIAAGVETKTNAYGAAEGPDGRALLVGVVVRGALSHPEGGKSAAHFDARQAATLGPADYDGLTFGPGASFRNAFFAGYASFDDAIFVGGVYFQGATFAEFTSFDAATFSGEAAFHRASFADYTSFSGATFAKDVAFYGATFAGVIGFDETVFSAIARFGRVAFSRYVTFDGATFSGSALFEGASFSDVVSFEKVTFSQEANYDEATFFKEVSFEGVAFPGRASFDSTTFTGIAIFNRASFAAEANFDRSNFASRLYFTEVKVGGPAQFEGGRCESTAFFNSSSFAGDFLAPYREFLGRTWWNDVVFGGRMHFRGAAFEKLVSFEKITWPKAARDWHGAFESVMFRWPALFPGSGFRSLAAFAGATLERGIQIDDTDEASANAMFDRERRAAGKAAHLDAVDFKKDENERRKAANKHARPVTGQEVRENRRTAREDRLKQLERGCRVLKQAMESASDKSREQLLYRFELQARRAQRGLPPGEKFFSDLYRHVSGYGASMVRPLFALVVLIGAFNAGFFLWADALGLVGPGEGQIDTVTAALQAFDLSWANVFKPLSALSAEAKEEGSLGDRLMAGQTVVASAVRGAATIQSILAIVLAFLFALAVRRRFQIS